MYLTRRYCQPATVAMLLAALLGLGYTMGCGKQTPTESPSGSENPPAEVVETPVESAEVPAMPSKTDTKPEETPAGAAEALARSEEAPTGSDEVPAVVMEAPAEPVEDDAVEPSKDAVEPSEDAEARLRTIREAMVLVTIRFNGESYAEPGMVFHRHGDQAFVVVRPRRELRGINGRSGIVAGPDYVVEWWQGDQRRSVPCQRVSAVASDSYFIVGAPADRLPPPISLDAAAEPTAQMPVHVIGYEEDRFVSPRGYAPFAERGSVFEVDRNREGKVSSLQIKCPEAPNISYAVVVSASGRIVGHTSGSRDPDTTDPYQFWTLPAKHLTGLLEPQGAFFEFGFESGDTKQVVYEFVAVLNDPCQRINSPEVSFMRQSPGEYNDEIMARAMALGEGRSPPPPPPTDTLPDSTTLALEKRAPSEAFVLQYPSPARYGSDNVYVARFTAPNPGPSQRYEFQGQVSYVDPSGKKVYLPRKKLEFRTQNRISGEVPAIPGIDGKPLDVARPVVLSDGTYRITSESTRVEPDATDVAVELPEPVASGKVVAGKIPGVGGRRAITLDVAPGEAIIVTRVPVIPAVFSPDGAWLYLVDAKGVIRKISTSDFVEQVSLETGGRRMSLGFSRAGLVATTAKAIYVLDPASLKVKRAIATDGAQAVAASAATDIGFAAARVEPQDPRYTPLVSLELLMIDFEKGRILHRIKGIDSLYGTPYVSEDGKHLFINGLSSAKGLFRLRIEGEDLILEKTFGVLPLFMGEGTLVSKQERNVRAYWVHDLNEPDQPKYEIDLGVSGPSAVDPISGLVYFLHRAGRMYAFDASGKEVGDYVVSAEDVDYLLPHPGGQRLLGWGDKKVHYFDLELDRLTKAVDFPRGDANSPDETVYTSPLAETPRPLTPGNLVASMGMPAQPVIHELSPRGEVVQSIDVPRSPEGESASDIRDVAVGPDGSLYVIFEYIKPSNRTPREKPKCVALLGPDRKEWRCWILPVGKKSHYGSLGEVELRKSGEVAILISENDAFLLDPRKESNALTPIPPGTCMALGPEGTYYTSGEPNERGTIAVYDLDTLRMIRMLTPEDQPGSIVVDEEANVYVASTTTVTKISPDGGTKRLRVSMGSSSDAIWDITLLPNGKLAMGSRSGRLFIVDRDLDEENLFATLDEDLAGWVAGIPEEPSKPAPTLGNTSPR